MELLSIDSNYKSTVNNERNSENYYLVNENILTERSNTSLINNTHKVRYFYSVCNSE